MARCAFGNARRVSTRRLRRHAPRSRAGRCGASDGRAWPPRCAASSIRQTSARRRRTCGRSLPRAAALGPAGSTGGSFRRVPLPFHRTIFRESGCPQPLRSIRTGFPVQDHRAALRTDVAARPPSLLTQGPACAGCYRIADLKGTTSTGSTPDAPAPYAPRWRGRSSTGSSSICRRMAAVQPRSSWSATRSPCSRPPRPKLGRQAVFIVAGLVAGSATAGAAIPAEANGCRRNPLQRRLRRRPGHAAPGATGWR